MGSFPRELSDRREVFDRAVGRCQCIRRGICHTPYPPFLAGRCSRTFEFWMDGWVVEYQVPAGLPASPLTPEGATAVIARRDGRVPSQP